MHQRKGIKYPTDSHWAYHRVCYCRTLARATVARELARDKAARHVRVRRGKETAVRRRCGCGRVQAVRHRCGTKAAQVLRNGVCLRGSCVAHAKTRKSAGGVKAAG